MGKKTTILQGATKGIISQKKHRRSRKPKFEVGKPKQGYDHKKKDKKRKQKLGRQIAKLGPEEFPLMFAQVREMGQRLRELNTEIDAYILDKLKSWDEGDKASVE
ncbi:uncharacterized protein LOC120198123 [Hibiscus syriacus]|uniref:uncharacterized protein LOC120198123 n=1 Tax=Hibiscus syriacus TaxID=106335 RepID=UPI001923A7E1|nr:uncharacterized protein LOC120198123 [Hibiscus syriacus]